MENIRFKVEIILENIGLNKIIINDMEMHTNGKLYVKLTFLSNLNSYVLEYADSISEAENNLFEDGDTFSIFMEENSLLDSMREEIVKALKIDSYS